MTVAGRVGDGNSLYILFSRRGHFVGTVLFCVYVDDITFLKRYPALSVFGLDSACFQQCRLRRSPASAGQVTFSGSTQPSVVAGSSRTRRLPLPVDLAPATFGSCSSYVPHLLAASSSFGADTRPTQSPPPAAVSVPKQPQAVSGSFRSPASFSCSRPGGFQFWQRLSFCLLGPLGTSLRLHPATPLVSVFSSSAPASSGF